MRKKLATRHCAWLPVAALHLLALLAVWPAAGPPAAKPGPQLVKVRLLAAPRPSSPLPPPSPLPWRRPALAALPPVLPIPAPALALAAEPSPAPSMTTPMPPTPPMPSPPAPAAPAPAAAIADAPPGLPPGHGACSARGIERHYPARGIERHYPALLRERGIQGRVLLRVQVDEQGRAAEVQVHSGSGWRLLDEAARRVALACPFVPARRGEQTMAAWVEYPVRFALN